MDGGSSATIDTAGLAPGVYDYFCLVHPYMTGKLQVAE
jgi:plastocyanin